MNKIYKFKDENLDQVWRTHPSYKENLEFQRMEFLGDKIISYCLSEHLINQVPKLSEGQLSLNLENMINKTALSTLADFLEEDILFKDSLNEKILADCLEAWIGCIFLDGGDVKSIIEQIWGDKLQMNFKKNPKNELQELLQSKKQSPIYIYQSNGKDFTVQLKINNLEVTTTAASKKEASKQAAKLMIRKLSAELGEEPQEDFFKKTTYETSNSRPLSERTYSRRTFTRRTEGDGSSSNTDRPRRSFTRRTEGDGSFSGTDRPRRTFTRRTEGDGSFSGTDRPRRSFTRRTEVDGSSLNTDRPRRSFTRRTEGDGSFSGTDRPRRTFTRRTEGDGSFSGTDRPRRTFTRRTEGDGSFSGTDRPRRTFTRRTEGDGSSLNTDRPRRTFTRRTEGDGSFSKRPSTRSSSRSNSIKKYGGDSRSTNRTNTKDDAQNTFRTDDNNSRVRKSSQKNSFTQSSKSNLDKPKFGNRSRKTSSNPKSEKSFSLMRFKKRENQRDNKVENSRE